MFGIYLWALIIYAILRATGLIKRFALQEHLLGEYLSLPIKFIELISLKNLLKPNIFSYELKSISKLNNFGGKA